MSGPDIGDTLVVIGNIHDNPELLEGGALNDHKGSYQDY